MQIAYMRVSTADGSQANDLQHDALIAAGVDPAQLYEDQASGKREDRPGLANCLKALRPGDTLVVWKLDRLGRDLRLAMAAMGQAKPRSAICARNLASRGRPCACIFHRQARCDRMGENSLPSNYRISITKCDNIGFVPGMEPS